MKKKREFRKVQVAQPDHNDQNEPLIKLLPTEQELFRLFWGWACAEARHRGVIEFEDTASIALAGTFTAYDPIKAFRALLNRILANRINDALRRQARRLYQPLDLEMADDSGEQMRQLSALTEEIHFAISQLPLQDRQVIVESLLEADVTDGSSGVSTKRVRQFRVRGKLRKLLLHLREA